MHDSARPEDKEEWVVWNDSAGILLTATLGRVEVDADGRNAWLDRPFDMVGPFSLDELETRGRIAFAACVVMSRRKWQEDQAELRREAYEKRRAAQARMEAEYARFNESMGWPSSRREQLDDRPHRETLNLPMDGKLEPAQIKAAFRRLAQKMHPDVGGSHEQFIRITQARDVLLEGVA